MPSGRLEFLISQLLTDGVILYSVTNETSQASYEQFGDISLPLMSFTVVFCEYLVL